MVYLSLGSQGAGSPADQLHLQTNQAAATSIDPGEIFPRFPLSSLLLLLFSITFPLSNVYTQS